MPTLIIDAQRAALLVGFDLDEHVARIELALGLALLPGAHLDDFLGWHQHPPEAILHAEAFDPLFQRTRDLMLEARIGVDHVPALAHD